MKKWYIFTAENFLVKKEQKEREGTKKELRRDIKGVIVFNQKYQSIVSSGFQIPKIYNFLTTKTSGYSIHNSIHF